MTGEPIAGRYRVERRLGAGGMSQVHLAFDTRLERPVAVKLLAEHLAEDPTFVSRFQREALAAARLVHPNVVQVFDYGLDETTHRHFIVMEHVDGPSCHEMLRERGRLGLDETLDIVEQACRGLDYAHRHGVVHRDVKPGNLLRSKDGTLKLADFGIARAMDQSSITQAGSVLGTAAYLAPEQARGEEAGPAADLYGLGVVAYQLLTGRLPYEAQSLSELVLRQQREAPPRLDVLAPGTPPAIAEAISHALALDPAQRYPDAPAMAAALRAAKRGVAPAPSTAATQMLDPTGATRPLAAEPATGVAPAHHRGPTPVTGRPRPEAPLAAPETAAPPPRRRRRGRRALAWLFVLLLLGAGAAAAVVASSESGQGVEIRDVIVNEVDQAVDELIEVIEENTR